ncbi:MAG: hypothetical protein AMJ59_20340 [Gammaproteobacteria bacterium SG8_31]|jgi:dihydroorotate dehydrogenase|nr:MAG: hypothetical protein AMJ59_20340 [Gammaproteobacteria bacterium SG8_31]
MTAKVRIENVQRNAAIFREVLEGKTLSATGREFGISGPAVRQLIGRMVHDIREHLDENEVPGPHSRGVKELRDSKAEWLVLLEAWIERHSRS